MIDPKIFTHADRFYRVAWFSSLFGGGQKEPDPSEGQMVDGKYFTNQANVGGMDVSVKYFDSGNSGQYEIVFGSHPETYILDPGAPDDPELIEQAKTFFSITTGLLKNTDPETPEEEKASWILKFLDTNVPR